MEKDLDGWQSHYQRLDNSNDRKFFRHNGPLAKSLNSHPVWYAGPADPASNAQHRPMEKDLDGLEFRDWPPRQPLQ
jgi:hypothetical protein